MTMSDENDKTWEKKAKHYESLANEYIDKFRELKKVIDRKTDRCRSCEKKQQHINRYRAEISELKADKEMLEKFKDKVMFSKEETSKLQEENAELKDNLKNLSKQLKEYEN
ncbi:Hypothetical predicted protein, partial [Mytilus galloprovincialis]